MILKRERLAELAKPLKAAGYRVLAPAESGNRVLYRELVDRTRATKA